MDSIGERSKQASCDIASYEQLIFTTENHESYKGPSLLTRLLAHIN